MLGALVVVLTTLISSVEMPLVSAAGSRFQVIVHSANPVSSLTRAQLSAIFLKRARRWPDRVDITAIDQSETSDVRESFSRFVHEKSAAYVVRYWHRLIFSGRALPPPQLASDEAVIEFVKANRGAIGYVSANTPLPAGVRVIAVTK